MYKLQLKKKWFNPLYFIINELAKDDSIRTILIYGGKSSSKTISICQVMAKEVYVKGSNCIAYRKESNIIPTTLKKSFNLAVESMRLNPVYEIQDRKYLCQNQLGKQSEIVLKGLDSQEKAKGIESYKYILWDELNHFSPLEYEQMKLSMRGIRGQKFFGTWNPVDENSWVKTELVDLIEWQETEYNLPNPDSFVKKSIDGKTILIKTNYEDNYWITGSPCGTYGYKDENLIAEYEHLRTTNYNSYKINVLGEWGKTTYGGEFLKCWRSEMHTGIYPYDHECAIYLSFDENTVPYFPCGVFQIGRDCKSPRLIWCITAKSPNNTIKYVCSEINRKLTAWGHKGHVFVGGDATSQKDDVKQEKGHDLFKLIMNELAQWKPIRKTTASNPSVIASKDFFNSILAGDVPDLSFGAHKDCKVAISDYENTKEDGNGKVDKKTVIDPITKVSYQPWGHIVDLTRYFICSVFAKEYDLYRNPQRPAYTPPKQIERNDMKFTM